MSEEKMVTLDLENGGTITIPEKSIVGVGFKDIAQPAPFGGPFGCPVDVHRMYYATIFNGSRTVDVFVTKESVVTAAEIYQSGRGEG